MPVNTALVVAAFILCFTAIAMIIFLVGRKRQAREEEMKQAAAARGWKFDSRFERGRRIHQWSGSTDGISWRAESIHYTSKHDRRQQRHHVSRWHGDFSPGITGPIALLGVQKGTETPSVAIAQGDGFFAKLAQKAVGFAFDKAIDKFFGDEAGEQVDAAALHQMDVNLPGFIVMAADKDEGARILSQGLEAALVAAIDDKASVIANPRRPSILLRPNTISLSKMERFVDITQLEAFIRAGVGLTRAFTFGRRSPS